MTYVIVEWFTGMPYTFHILLRNLNRVVSVSLLTSCVPRDVSGDMSRCIEITYWIFQRQTISLCFEVLLLAMQCQFSKLLLSPWIICILKLSTFCDIDCIRRFFAPWDSFDVAPGQRRHRRSLIKGAAVVSQSVSQGVDRIGVWNAERKIVWIQTEIGIKGIIESNHRLFRGREMKINWIFFIKRPRKHERKRANSKWLLPQWIQQL